MAGTKRNTPDGDRLDVLVTLVEAYEARHFPLDLPDPVEAIKFVMEQRNLTVKDLVPYIGQPNRVYEVLKGKTTADHGHGLEAAQRAGDSGRIPDQTSRLALAEGHAASLAL